MSAIERGLRRGMSWVITLLTPFVLIMTSIRILISHLFLELEYHAQGFPPDPYGFTLADRLKWGGLSIDYLLNRSGLSFLSDLRFADGTPIYNARELSHMQDVKILVQTTLGLWVMALGVLVLLGVIAYWRKWGRDYQQGLSRGGWLTIGVLALVLVGVAASFSWLFTEFHRIFFTGDTWLFYYSDTLIRLFPMRLWQDAFILLGIICIAGGLFCALALRPGKQPRRAADTARAH
jgi:integral membrane protein (TIGR01906 family)